MARTKKQEDKFTKRRLRSSYVTSLISITLVLLILGFFGWILLSTQIISNYVKENIQINVYLHKNVKEAEILKLKKRMDLHKGVNYTKYISPEDGAQLFQEDLGEEFMDHYLDENPIPPTIELHMKKEYANVDSLKAVSNFVLNTKIVDEVQFHEDYVKAINDNIARISIFLLVFSGLLLFIAIALISNTIRLSVYAQRFNIRTMQLIGATQGFIRKPFIGRGIMQGFIGSIIANGLLVLFLYKAQSHASEIIDIKYIDSYIILIASVTFIGIIISWWSTYFSVRKYLKSKLDNLYLM